MIVELINSKNKVLCEIIVKNIRKKWYIFVDFFKDMTTKGKDMTTKWKDMTVKLKG